MASSVPWVDQQTHFWEWWSSILEPENKDEEALNISHHLPAWNNHSDCLRVSPSDVHITVALRQLRNLSFVIKMICRTHWIAQAERDTALATNVLYLSQAHLDLVWKISESLSPIQFNCQKCKWPFKMMTSQVTKGKWFQPVISENGVVLWSGKKFVFFSVFLLQWNFCCRYKTVTSLSPRWNFQQAYLEIFFILEPRVFTIIFQQSRTFIYICWSWLLGRLLIRR